MRIEVDPEVWSREWWWDAEFWDSYAPGGLAFTVLLACGSLYAVLMAMFWMRTARLWKEPDVAVVLTKNMRLSLGDGSWDSSRSHVRASVAISVIGAQILIGVSVFFVRFIPGAPWQYIPIALALVVTNIFWGVVWLSIVWLNRPQFLVPPHMRSDPGLLEVRRALRDGADISRVHAEYAKQRNAAHDDSVRPSVDDEGRGTGPVS